MKVRFIGLGRMGHVMRRRLLDGGHEVAVYNRTPEDKITGGAGSNRNEVKPAGGKVRRRSFTMLTDGVAESLDPPA